MLRKFQKPPRSTPTYAVPARTAKSRSRSYPEAGERRGGLDRKQALFKKGLGAVKGKKERKEALKQRKMKLNRNYSVVVDITRLWEKLRPREVSPKERQKWVGLAMSRVQGHIADLVQNPKASRVLQACLQYGTSAERHSILTELHQKLPTLAKTKYGKHLVQRLILKTPQNDFAAVFDLFSVHTSQLLKHQYGSDVMNDLYYKSSELQRHALMMACYGKEFYASLMDDWTEQYSTLKAAGVDPSSFEVLMKGVDPVRRAQVLEKLHGLLSAVIEKGLLVNRLVHRLILEFFRSAPAPQVEDLAVTLAETGDGLLKMVHTEEGVSVAAAVLSYTSPALRKGTLRGFKDYIRQTALDEWGYMLLIMAFRVVDDTKMLRKVLMTGIVEHLEEISQHRYGRCILLDLLHPDCSWYLPAKTEQPLQPRRLEIPHQATGDIRIPGLSKKDGLTRRQELLSEGELSLESALVELCRSKTADLLQCRRGCDVLVEVARGAEGGILQKPGVQAVHSAIIQACISDPSLLTERISKGALTQLIQFSKGAQPTMAKAFCKAFWKGIFKHHCSDWMDLTQRRLLAALVTCGSKLVRTEASEEVGSLLEGVSFEEWLAEVAADKKRKRQEAIEKRIHTQT